MVASLRVAEALDALRASTPATVFGLAAERWAERARREKDIEKDIERRVVARRASRAFAGETYVASKAARLLDDDESFVHSRNGNDETNDVTKTVRETFDRFARARATQRAEPPRFRRGVARHGGGARGGGGGDGPPRRDGPCCLWR